MALIAEGKTKAERNKMIAAIALGTVALLTLGYAFFGSSSKPKATRNTNVAGARPSPGAQTQAGNIPLPLPTPDELTPPQPIPISWTQPEVPEAGRNVFAFYVPPPPTPTPPPVIPTPTPTPPPPLMLASISPANVYARTGEFKLEVTGDKFNPFARVVFEGRELQTRYISPQQLSATVPASLIAGEGARQVMVRTPDGKLYSNTATLNVTPPPVPNFQFVGLIGGQRYNDTAVLKDKNNPKELLNVQRGDVIGGRFRITSISEREIALVDTTLNIKHTIPLTRDAQNNNPNFPQRPQPVDPESGGEEEP
jgi:hypothetical protein